MQKPLVSIIVPIYNVAAYLSECLQSLVGQSYEALDIILIDDGSDDESLKIALDFAARDGRIFVVSKPNGGLSSARNFGLEFVRGTGLREFFEGGVNFGENSQKNSRSAQITHPQTPSAREGAFNGSRNDEQGENSQNSAPFRHTERSEVSINQGVNLNVDSSPATQAQNDDLGANFVIFSSNSTQNLQISVNLNQNSQENSRSAQITHPQSRCARAFNGSRNDDSAAQIQSLAQTHTFKKTYKSISGKEIQAHFTQVAPNFIKSDLAQISDFITQELPPNALIHFVDSDDYLTKDCIEKCVQALCEQGLKLIAHNLTHFYEKSGEFKEDDFLGKMRQNAYESGLELLSENKFTSLYFSVQGLFKAELLNRYALRFCEGIYHEDHDFGTLLFALAGKVAYTSEPLYIYRERPNSTMTSYQSTAMPAKMPYFLEPLREHFSDYKALRAYFKAYCFVLVGFKIWHFYEQKSEKDSEFRQKFKDFFAKSTLSYMKIFKTSLNPDPLGIKELLKSIKFTKSSVLCEFFKDLHRQPKKLRHFANLKYLLTKDTQ